MYPGDRADAATARTTRSAAGGSLRGMEHDMSNATGRTGGNIRHLRHMGSKEKGTPGNTRADRRDLLRESMRDLDPAEADFFASKPGSSIVRDDTHLNVAMVNNGDGTFRRPTGIQEVLDYGDARIGPGRDSGVHKSKEAAADEAEADRVGGDGRKWNPNSFETTLIAAHLPKSMCVEIPNFYPIIDDKTGEPVLDANDEPMMRSRWVSRDRDEALRYFDEVVRYYAEDVLNGGVDAIHGYDINFDESTPHVQIMADTLAPNPKHDGKLRCESSQMWGSHRDVTELRADKDGVVREMMELPQNKMSRYQKGLRDRMVSLGYPVEADYDQERHLSGSGKAEYAATMDARRVADEMVDYVEERGEQLDAREVDLDAQAAEITADRAQLDRDLADLPGLRRRAREEEVARVREETAEDRAAAARARQEAEQAAEATKAAQRAAEGRMEQVDDLARALDNVIPRSDTRLRPILDKELARRKTLKSTVGADRERIAEEQRAPQPPRQQTPAERYGLGS